MTTEEEKHPVSDRLPPNTFAVKDDHITLIAAIIGFNEMARQAPTLGEKVWHRDARDKMIEHLRAEGGEFRMDSDGVITLDTSFRPSAPFLPSDIELMRAVVAGYDAAKGER